MILSQRKQRIIGPESIAPILYSILNSEDATDQDKEHFWVVGLNGTNVIQYLELACLGILNRCNAHPREIFRLAITKAVNSIIVAHNHPSGNLDPSDEDREITRKLVESGEILGIPVMDSMIIGNLENPGAFYSFHDNAEL